MGCGVLYKREPPRISRVVQAVLQRPAALPLPSAGANLRRVRPVTAGLSGAFLY